MKKIGFDFHGVLDADPDIFGNYIKNLLECNHEVHIITGHEDSPGFRARLTSMGIKWTHFFSIISYHKKTGTKITYDTHGNPWMDKELWNLSKANYCKKNKIDILIDDSTTYAEYFKGLSTQYFLYHHNRIQSFEARNSDKDPVNELIGLCMNKKKTKKVSEDAPSVTLKDDLSNYDPREYDDPSVTTDIIILTIFKNDIKVLLIERKNAPYRNCKALPGGFLDVGREESLEETAARELVEETNLKDIYVEQLKTYGKPDRDPRKRVITVAYFALIPYSDFKEQVIRAGDDAKEGSAKWFSLKRPPKNLAFDHKKILKDTLGRIRGKVSYSDIAFNLLPKKFTWAELQKVYEIILGRKLLAANFRRKIKSMYILKELKETKKGEGVGRPSVLLKYVRMKKL